MPLRRPPGILDMEAKPTGSRRGRPMDSSLTVIAGFTSTIIFAASALPMLAKAYRTKDLSSYSRGNILLANTGNLVHSVYVFALPPGPIWLLHTFYLISTAMMLVWYLRYERRSPRASQAPEYPARTPRSGHELAPIDAIA
jgi:hypothetical protein